MRNARTGGRGSVQKGYLRFPFRHPLFQPQPTLKYADVVLVLEADVPWLPSRNSPPADAYVVSVGHEPIKLRIPTYEFTADIRLPANPLPTIRAITAAAQDLLAADDRARIAEPAARLHETSRATIETLEQDTIDRSGETPIDPLGVNYRVGKLQDDNCFVLDDTLGTRLQDHLSCARPGSYFGNPGSSGGWSSGAALGAKLAAPDRDIVAVSGDGICMFGTHTPAIWATATTARRSCRSSTPTGATVRRPRVFRALTARIATRRGRVSRTYISTRRSILPRRLGCGRLR